MTPDQTAPPTGPDRDAQRPETTRAASPVRTTDVADRPIRILHVDDDPSFSDLLSSFLTEHDREFVLASETSAAAALERLDEEYFDCVVSEYQMPSMDGLALLDAVRRRYRRLPFILFTCRGSDEVDREAIAGHLTEFVRKGSVEQYEKLARRIDGVVTSIEAGEDLRTR